MIFTKPVYLYVITNFVNDKWYIGITNNPKKRWSSHKKSNTPVISKAIKKYGCENFEFKIITSGTRQEMFKLEEICIAKFNTQVPNGYNIAPGGEYNKPSTDGAKRISAWAKKRRHSPEIIEKIRTANTGLKRTQEFCERLRKANLGKKHTPETCEKLRKANLGKKHTPETRERIRKSNTGKRRTKEFCTRMSEITKGRKQTTKCIEALRQANTGANNHNAKAVIVNGVQYDTVVSAARSLGLNIKTIKRRIKYTKQKYIGYQYANPVASNSSVG
jgi:group I intron endonuclease